jgi:hypothetical protein
VETRTIAGSTGLLTLPRTGKEFSRMIGIMMALLRTLKVLRRR